MGLRRIIPRFSLRTLVVFLLLVTSAGGLYSRYRVVRWIWPPSSVMLLPPSEAFSDFINAANRIDIYFSWPPLAQRGERRVAVTDHREMKELAGLFGTMTPSRSAWGYCVCVVVFTKGRQVMPVWAGEDFLTLWGDKSGAWGDEGWADFEMPAPLWARITHYRQLASWQSAWRHVEFWLTVAFAALLVWSILRDRKALRGEAA